MNDMPCSSSYLERATDAGTRSPVPAIARIQDEEEIAKRAWRAERSDDLASDTAALLDALDADAAHELLGDLIGALRGSNDGATAADRLILRYSAAEQRIELEIQAVLEREEALGRWQSYIYQPEREEA